METKNDEEARAKIWDMIKDIKFALLVTNGLDNKFHGRPMAAVKRDEQDRLWFMTRADSGKVEEIEKNPQVLLSYSEPKNQDYVSISGTATISHDRGKIKELWSEPMRTWFPKGAEDPNIALICVDANAAEYWDSPSSAVVYAYGYAKALITGTSPNPGDNGHVNL